jgi:hypothetical protein
MSSKGVGAFRPVARAGVIASSIALLAMVFSPSAAIAATTSLGATAGAGSWTCAAGFDLVQISSTAPNYTVPAGGGTITSWSTLADASMLGPVGLQVWKHTTGDSYQLVGASPLVALTPSVVNTFPLATPIPVLAGDLLGLRVEGVALCGQFGTGTYGALIGPNPSVGAVDLMTVYTGTDLNIQATLDSTAPPPPPPPPPPPSTGCDTTGQSSGGTSETPKQDSRDSAKHDSTGGSNNNDNCQQ